MIADNENPYVYSTAIFFFIFNVFLSNFITKNAQTPYMDEIFHVPQAQQYCDGNFTQWNDKITTLPGLYLLNALPARIFTILGSFDSQLLCTTKCLRLTNSILLSFTFILVFKLYKLIHSEENEPKNNTIINLVNAFAIILFPLNYFFQFLYYTDVGSTFFTLLGYYCSLRSRHYSASLFGLVSVMFRQTNIIWILFYFLLYLLNQIKEFLRQTKSKQAAISNLFHLAVQTSEYTSLLTSKKFYKKILHEDFSLKRFTLIKNIYQIISLTSLAPYIIQFTLFGIFINVNNGIVVGDRSNHEVSFHLCQLFYFSAFTFGLLFLTHSLKGFIKLAKIAFIRQHVLFLCSLALINLAIYKFTYEHKFLLADNRHYTFYIWSKFFKRHNLLKYALSPVYYFCIFCLYRLLSSNRKSFGWIIAYTVCVCACLIPQKLLEFRYFIIPFIIYRLNVRNSSIKHLFIEIIVYSSINLVTVYLFLFKTFHWPSSTETQRFMW